MLDWLIVGGGLQGRFVADALHAAAPMADIAVLDARAPLAAWQQRAAACGMTWLRSPGAHHLGRRTDSLRRFAARHGFDDRHRLGRYARPSHALFEAHAAHTHTALPRIVAHAEAVTRAGNGWRVHAEDGTSYRAARVVLALGPGRPFRPPWGAGLAHVYDADFKTGAATDERVAVVGGGTTGAQLALRLSAVGHSVTWLTRTRPRVAAFDSDPCYAGPKCLTPFSRLPVAERTAVLAAARRPGTLAPDVHGEITAALAAGRIAWRRGRVAGLDDAGVAFDDGTRLTADRVVLATGFEHHPAPGGLLARCMADHGLELDADGHVTVDGNLAAAPGLHLVGRPASLQLGPMAGNIKGARLAGERLANIALVCDKSRSISA